ncbi:hypothetical protein [Blastochloris sulfoviridis]|uniref:Uncharacterized protein n=1 Tax=Blastochloris sulfoviridis TaxID=50712 RepID=A0A5M6I512_9HYPH|nr:hypothetical protein [Blastochloris sulfoviridis]KAA5603310.1 hypothetical protein F1193_01280 [Blastochloris sulfoviridis]
MYQPGKWFDALFADPPERGQVIWLDRRAAARKARSVHAPPPTLGGERGLLVPFATFVARAQAKRRLRGRAV